MSDFDSMYHRNGPGNENNAKYISPDGHQEGVYRGGSLVTDRINGGTYNYADPQNNPIKHFVIDMVPYFILGN